MLDHSNHYVTVFFHYLFYLILVGLLTLGVTYWVDSDQEDAEKSNLEKIGSLVLKQAENSH